MEVTNYSSKAVGGTGLGLGIAGTALGLLNGGLGNLLNVGAPRCGCCSSDAAFKEVLGAMIASGTTRGCSEDHCVNRYEAGQAARIAELETEVKLRDANTFTMGEMNKLRDYMDGRINCVTAQINQQAVINAQVAANLSCMQGNIATLMGLTKTIVPIDNVCPHPMPQYNSWTAPTTAAAAG